MTAKPLEKKEYASKYLSTLHPSELEFYGEPACSPAMTDAIAEGQHARGENPTLLTVHNELKEARWALEAQNPRIVEKDENGKVADEEDLQDYQNRIHALLEEKYGAYGHAEE